MFAGAALSQAVWDQLDAHGAAAIGERLRIITGLGMTETAPSCTFAVGTDNRSGHIGLPVPGVEVKLVPEGDKTEIRFRGPNVMPGYWRAPEQTREAFDEEGFYRTGDAVRWIDPARSAARPAVRRPHGRRLQAVHRHLRQRGAAARAHHRSGRPLRAGRGDHRTEPRHGRRADLSAPGRLPPRRRLRRAHARAPQVLHHPAVRAHFQAMLDTLAAQATGSANRLERIHVLAEPPSIDSGELTDKNSINQRAVLQHRASLVDALYEGRASDPFIIQARPR